MKIHEFSGKKRKYSVVTKLNKFKIYDLLTPPIKAETPPLMHRFNRKYENSEKVNLKIVLNLGHVTRLD